MAAVPRKNIYIKDADAPHVQRFEQSGGNASELFSRAIADWVKQQERNALSDVRIELTVVREGAPDTTKAFVGHWLIEPEEGNRLCYSAQENVMAGSIFGVAITRKGNFVAVVTDRLGASGPLTVYAFDVADSLDDLADEYPEDILNNARAVMGEVEELDI